MSAAPRAVDGASRDDAGAGPRSAPFQAALEAAVPAGARVLVVSGGDARWLDLAGREAAHFPQGEGGGYAGAPPAGNAEAISHLEELRGRGADYLLLPAPSFWWLEEFGEFRHHLDARYDRVCSDENCVVFGLRRREDERLADERANHLRALNGLMQQLRGTTVMLLGSSMATLFPAPAGEVEELTPRQQEKEIKEIHSSLKMATSWWEMYLARLVQEAATPLPAVITSFSESERVALSYDVTRLVQYPDQKPIFILGAPRSGTTAVRNALGALKGFAGWPEGHLFTVLPFLLGANKKVWDGALQMYQEPVKHFALGQFDVYTLLNGVVESFNRHYEAQVKAQGGVRWIDKTPNMEALVAVPLLNHIYPNARYVFMHRHPLKFLLSWAKKFTDKTLEQGGVMWAGVMNTWGQIKKGLKPESFVEIPQADLSLKPDEVVGKLQTLLGLNPKQAETVREVLAKKRPEYTGSSEDAGDLFLEDLPWPEVFKKWCKDVGEPTAKKWGYEVSRG